MNIDFLKFNVTTEYWVKVKEFLKNNDVTEQDVRNCLMHTSTNFVIEKCSRFYTDHTLDLKVSYSIQSQRYVNFKDKYDFFYTPDEIKQKGYQEHWNKHVNEMIEKYSLLVDGGIQPEDARFILPITFLSNDKVTLLGDKLFDFIEFNYNYSAFDEHRQMLDAFLNKFDPEYKILLDKIMMIIKKKAADFRRPEYYKNIWTQLFKPGEFGIYFHNDIEFESALGASICYRKGSPSEYIEDFGSDKRNKLLQKILDVKHESVMEHGMITIQMPISRIIHTHIQRHRILNRTYTSNIEAAKNFSYVIPPEIAKNENLKNIFEDGMAKTKEFYNELCSNGVSEENSSYILPNALKIDTILTLNVRAIRDIIRTRICERVHWEVRALIYKVFEELYKNSPTLVSGLGPSCYLGKCKEGEFACGKSHIFKDFISELSNKAE